MPVCNRLYTLMDAENSPLEELVDGLLRLWKNAKDNNRMALVTQNLYYYAEESEIAYMDTNGSGQILYTKPDTSKGSIYCPGVGFNNTADKICRWQEEVPVYNITEPVYGYAWKSQFKAPYYSNQQSVVTFRMLREWSILGETWIGPWRPINDDYLNGNVNDKMETYATNLNITGGYDMVNDVILPENGDIRYKTHFTTNIPHFKEWWQASQYYYYARNYFYNGTPTLTDFKNFLMSNMIIP